MDFVKKNDKLISLLVLLLTVILVFIVTRTFFLDFATDFPLIGGFIKFFFLASIGDFIGVRLKTKSWKIPKNIFLKAIVWGFIGIVIVLMFTIFSTGVLQLQEINILPFEGSTFAFALFTSILMNVIFAPTMMAFHRVSDTLLDGVKSIDEAVRQIDWGQFFKVVILRTIPLFWIPAHTITFLLPAEYRVIFAAVLGIFLGLILRVFKK
jgi:hypothetical protein